MNANETNQSDYEAIRAHLMSALLSSHEQYDRAILTLSTGLLGLSVAFVRPNTGTPAAQMSCTLVLSWLCLLVAIIATVLSLLASQLATRRAIDDAHNLYRLKKLETLQSTNAWSEVTKVLNLCSAAGFLLGAVLTVVFVILTGK